MEDRKYRTYPKEFKLEALEMLKYSGKSAGQIERELGITPGLLHKWRNRYQILENGSQPARIGPSDLEEAKAEIRRLRRELSAAEKEREILKKRSTFSPEKTAEVCLHL
jgi:transposase